MFCPSRGTTRAQMATFLHRAENRAEPTTPPPYKAVDSGLRHACAVRSDNTVTCWGYNEGGQVSTPDGEFLTVSAGRWHNCGLRPDRTIACWGYNSDGQLDAPAGEFSEVSAGDVHNCALRTDGTAVCWGSNRIRKAEAPSGEFTSVHAANEHSCGLRTDGTIACWGIDVIALPAGAERGIGPRQPDPSVCRPYGPDRASITAGFPLPEATASKGTLRVVVLFVDFPDIRARHTTYDEAARGLPYAEAYMEVAQLRAA